jgi:hypothetical protein
MEAEMSTPGDYYDRKTAEARRLREELAAARKNGADGATIRRLERALERAEYVGD